VPRGFESIAGCRSIRHTHLSRVLSMARPKLSTSDRRRPPMISMDFDPIRTLSAPAEPISATLHSAELHAVVRHAPLRHDVMHRFGMMSCAASA
jgi:hypothetical protein